MLHGRTRDLNRAKFQATYEDAIERYSVGEQKSKDILSLKEQGKLTESETILKLVEVIAAEPDYVAKYLLTKYLAVREPGSLAVSFWN